MNKTDKLDTAKKMQIFVIEQNIAVINAIGAEMVEVLPEGKNKTRALEILKKHKGGALRALESIGVDKPKIIVPNRKVIV